MRTSWAVASATLLGVTAAVGFTAFGDLLFTTPFHLMVFAALAAFASWAYAMVRSVHRGKGALVAVLVYDVGFALQVGVLNVTYRAQPLPQSWWSWPILLLGAVAAVAVVGELRKRRGGIEWRTALALSAGFVPFAAWSFFRLVA